MKVVKAILFTVVAVIVSSCAFNPPVESRKATFVNAKSIVIVTSVGKRAELDYVGFTVFNNINEKIDISSWGMSEKMLAIAKDSLKGRFEIKLARYEAELEAIKYRPTEYRDFSGSSEQVLRPFLERIQKETQSDIVFIISQWPDGVPLRVVNTRDAGQRVQVPTMMSMIDTKTGVEIFGIAAGVPCDYYKFDFKAANLKAELERQRPTIEKLWLACATKSFDAFMARAGL